LGIKYFNDGGGLVVEKEKKDLENSMNISHTEITSIKLIGMIDKTEDLIQQIFDKFYKKYKLSKTQFSALYRIYLAGEDGITLSVLGDQMSVTRANITSLADRMVARNLIKRIVNENDRRSIKAVITSEGIEILEKVLPNNQAFSSEILNCLTKQEKNSLYELLLKVQNELTEIYSSQ
jgi:MarR family 2-MHQ and catechol resistance regulon transcriptional repressor